MRMQQVSLSVLVELYPTASGHFHSLNIPLFARAVQRKNGREMRNLGELIEWWCFGETSAKMTLAARISRWKTIRSSSEQRAPARISDPFANSTKLRGCARRRCPFFIFSRTAMLFPLSESRKGFLCLLDSFRLLLGKEIWRRTLQIWMDQMTIHLPKPCMVMHLSIDH